MAQAYETLGEAYVKLGSIMGFAELMAHSLLLSGSKGMLLGIVPDLHILSVTLAPVCRLRM